MGDPECRPNGQRTAAWKAFADAVGKRKVWGDKPAPTYETMRDRLGKLLKEGHRVIAEREAAGKSGTGDSNAREDWHVTADRLYRARQQHAADTAAHTAATQRKEAADAAGARAAEEQALARAGASREASKAAAAAAAQRRGGQANTDTPATTPSPAVITSPTRKRPRDSTDVALAGILDSMAEERKQTFEVAKLNDEREKQKLEIEKQKLALEERRLALEEKKQAAQEKAQEQQGNLMLQLLQRALPKSGGHDND